MCARRGEVKTFDSTTSVSRLGSAVAGAIPFARQLSVRARSELLSLIASSRLSHVRRPLPGQADNNKHSSTVQHSTVLVQ
jgi:hypothetical protein